MSPKHQKNIIDIVKELGRYSLDAFEFLHRGLDYTVQEIHGPPDVVLRKLAEWMESNGVEPSELESLICQEEIIPPIVAAIEHYGGPQALRQKMNRHVTGEELCWGLRDYALNQWGPMAPAVLRAWGIRSTRDFGTMVFTLVDNGLLQKQPDDHIDNFDDVYDFDKAFSGVYKITLSDNRSDQPVE